MMDEESHPPAADPARLQQPMHHRRPRRRTFIHVILSLVILLTCILFYQHVSVLGPLLHANVNNNPVQYIESSSYDQSTLIPTHTTTIVSSTLEEELHKPQLPFVHVADTLDAIPVIPKPVRIFSSSSEGSYFQFHSHTILYYDDSKTNSTLSNIATYLAQQLQIQHIQIYTPFTLDDSRKIQDQHSQVYLTFLDFNQTLVLENDFNTSWNVLGTEGYWIHISCNTIHIQAFTQEGFFRSIQTLIQLIPPPTSTSTTTHPVEIPCGTILDYPAFPYRGIMMDIARHFFSLDILQRMVDILSLYKINHLHIHLSDDQGWRLEIPSFPNLTLVGGQTQVGDVTSGGYLTQLEYQQLTLYAQERYMTLVPEFDMPGHSNAILYSYPDLLSCEGSSSSSSSSRPEPFIGTFGGFSSLCLSNNNTWTFVKQVLTDVVDMTPGPFIHIGADEVFSMDKQDYCFFLNFASQKIQSLGKIMIGWDDIGICEMDHPYLIQWWRNWDDGERKVYAAVSRGHKVIMSPAKMTYMDMKYNEQTPLGQSSVGYVEVDKTYNWNPETILAGVDKDSILGVEAPLWTEFIYTRDDVDYMAFPRSIALAEVGWTSLPERNWQDFRKRLRGHYDRLTQLGVHFYKSPLVDE